MTEDLYRWCIYCKADCWLATQKHAPYCPVSTGLWPITQSDYDNDMCCGCCFEKFELDEYCMQLDTQINQVVLHGNVLEIICIGCAAGISILGVKYE